MYLARIRSVYVTGLLYNNNICNKHLLNYSDQETVKPRLHNGVEVHRPDPGLFTSRYQQERQRVYDRAAHVVNTAGYAHADVEDARAEAAWYGSKPR